MKPKADRPPRTHLNMDRAHDSLAGNQQQKLLLCMSFAAFLRHHSWEQSCVLALQLVASVSKPAARETLHEAFFGTRLHSYLLCYKYISKDYL